MPQELADAPELPKLVEHLWWYYLELHDGRGGNGFGANPIAYVDIQAWSQLARVRLEWWETNAIKAIDRLFRSTKTEEEEK
jgi:hypothetical protein